jgi:hypothetical protein
MAVRDDRHQEPRRALEPERAARSEEAAERGRRLPLTPSADGGVFVTVVARIRAELTETLARRHQQA